ncbi:hypothetical protein NEMBOFW57_008214 [Staphylotrichum longicolle]|uniref:Short-chain alcohol dehydrogenase n=1 Tax=Staphylotrichum longicolle TaxID=669026 RepID=A0AAD4HYQ5_9PEZI|nr:hypothetical protein NEMBOFW57_008214 [Staphylotrichum longicolle]
MPHKTLLVVGSGPGISRAVTSVFAAKRYDNVVLLARRTDSLESEKAAVEQAIGKQVNIKTYAVDITNVAALATALDDADAAFGKPECIFFNAARVLPSAFFEHPVTEIEYDFKITVSALYVVAQRYVPHLVSLAKADPASKPALLVTSSALPLQPIPQLFALSLTKAAQRNLVQSLNMTYGPEGVHIGVINVAGVVSPSESERNPANIAAKTWEWFEEGKEFELVI